MRTDFRRQEYSIALRMRCAPSRFPVSRSLSTRLLLSYYRKQNPGGWSAVRNGTLPEPDCEFDACRPMQARIRRRRQLRYHSCYGAFYVDPQSCRALNGAEVQRMYGSADVSSRLRLNELQPEKAQRRSTGDACTCGSVKKLGFAGVQEILVLCVSRAIIRDDPCRATVSEVR